MGDTLTYSLGGTDAASFDLVAASGQLRTKSGVAYDFETKSRYTVTVEVADDGNGGSDTVTVTITLTDANEPPAFDTAGLTVDATGRCSPWRRTPRRWARWRQRTRTPPTPR